MSPMSLSRHTLSGRAWRKLLLVVVFLPPWAVTLPAFADSGRPSVSFSPTSISFPPQLVGTTGSPASEVVTNTGTGPLVIRAIEVVGPNADDFIAYAGFGFPITVQPGNSLTLNVTFAPQLPWTPGTRRAKLQLQDNAGQGQHSVSLSGMGLSCAGPVLATSSGGLCADTDLDGLNDAWEDNDYIDLNNDGTFDAGVDFAFPHETPFVFSSVTNTVTGSGHLFPTVTNPGLALGPSSALVTIAAGGAVGAATFEYSLNGGVPVGPIEVRAVVDISANLRLLFYTTTGPFFVAGDNFSFTAAMGTSAKVVDKNVPNILVQYDYMDYDVPGNACVVDSDCDAGGLHMNDVCHSGSCSHSHFPGDPLFRKVVDQFAAHGIRLYIDPSPQPVPHALVVTWWKPGDGTTGATAACAGADVVAGNIGPGQQAVNFFDIKNRPGSVFALQPSRRSIYHYTVFSHASICLADFAGPLGYCGACPPPRSAIGTIDLAGQGGTAEVPGNDFIISLGATLNDPIGNTLRNPFVEQGTFMHELGHNLGLHHAGDFAAPNNAPNYLSVMNYRYSFGGIEHAAVPGSAVAVEDLREVNYSEHALRTLTETALDESAGTSPIAAGFTGIVRFLNAAGVFARGPESGPIDWTGNGVIDPLLVAVDINGLDVDDGSPEAGYRDWDHASVSGGSCTTSADCRVNRIRLSIHQDSDPAIDPQEPCLNGRCQSLWLNFQDTPWGKADGPAAGASRLVFESGVPIALPAAKINVSYDKARLRGTPEAPVTIVEFADFECSFCRQAERTLKEVLAKYEGKVAVAHRDFPLQEIHAASEQASEAARCSGDQGKFWEYRDLLLSSATLDSETLTGYARTLNLNAKDFDACLSANKYRAAVEQDVSEGKQAGVSATPTFFINGVRLTGAQPAAAFEAIINRQLAAMKESKK